MPKVWAEEGFRFYVYFNDYAPSHVHWGRTHKAVYSRSEGNVVHERKEDVHDCRQRAATTEEELEKDPWLN